MKIEITKKCMISGFERFPGDNLEVSRDVGNTLVTKGYAKNTEFVTNRDKIAKGIEEINQAEAEVEPKASKPKRKKKRR